MKVNGIDVWIGKVEMFGNDGIGVLFVGVEFVIEEFCNVGRIMMVVCLGDCDLGVIGFMDMFWLEVCEVLDKLRCLGI